LEQVYYEHVFSFLSHFLAVDKITHTKCGLSLLLACWLWACPSLNPTQQNWSHLNWTQINSTSIVNEYELQSSCDIFRAVDVAWECECLTICHRVQHLSRPRLNLNMNLISNRNLNLSELRVRATFVHLLHILFCLIVPLFFVSFVRPCIVCVLSGNLFAITFCRSVHFWF